MKFRNRLFLLLIAAFISYLELGIARSLISTILVKSSVSQGAKALQYIKPSIFNYINILFPLSNVLGNILIGIWSDKAGRKSAITLCLCFNLFAHCIVLVSLWLNSRLLMYGFQILAGLAHTIVPIILAAALTSRFNRNVKAVGLLNMMFGIGCILGSTIGSHLATQTTDSLIFSSDPSLILILLALCNISLISFGYKNEKCPDEIEEQEYIAKKHFKLTQLEKEQLIQTNFVILKGFYPAFFIFCLGWFSFYISSPVLLEHRFACSKEQVFQFFIAMNVVYAVVSGVFCPFCSKWIRAERWMEIMIVVQSFICLGLFWIPNIYLFIALSMALMLCLTILLNIAQAWVRDLSGKKTAGRAFGKFHAMYALAWIISTIAIRELHGMLSVTFCLIASCLILLSAILFHQLCSHAIESKKIQLLEHI